MRKVKDAKDLSSNELIYFKGHAKATYMSDGSTVEDSINNLIVSGGGTGGGNVDLVGYATETYVDNKVATKQDVISDLDTIRSNASKGETAVQPSTLATVATSGSYNDLINKPTIPNAVSESTVSGWGFTKNSGTITGVSANGTSIATSGVANIPAASTSAYGVTKLSSSTSSTSTSLAATASAVKSAYDLANGKQDKLTSGTNIKTINGQSLLGSGNITISGGGNTGSSSAAYGLVEHGTSDTTFTLTPNTFHVWNEVASLTLTLGEEATGVANEYIFQFTSGATTTLTLPDDIRWTNEFSIESNKIYQISILNRLGTVMSWEVTTQGGIIGGGSN